MSNNGLGVRNICFTVAPFTHTHTHREGSCLLLAGHSTAQELDHEFKANQKYVLCSRRLIDSHLVLTSTLLNAFCRNMQLNLFPV